MVGGNRPGWIALDTMGRRNAVTDTDRCALFVYAHPDDEVFSPGGTIALLTDRGVRVVLALATAGEEGEADEEGAFHGNG